MLETFKRRNFIHRTAEKRREISRCAAKQRREKESDVFTELYSTVPIVEEPKVSHVDRIAVLRLAASFCRFRQVAEKVLNPPRISLLDEQYETSFLNEMLGESKTMDVLSGFLLVVDSQASIIYISPNVSRSLGLTQTDLIGHNLYEFIKDDDIGEMRATFGRAQLDTASNKIFIRMKSVLGARGRNLNLRSALYKTMALTVSKHHVDTKTRNSSVDCHRRSSKSASRLQAAAHHLQPHKNLIHHLVNKSSPPPPPPASAGSPYSGSNSGQGGASGGQRSPDVDLDVDVKEFEGSGSGSAPSITGIDDDRATSTSSNGSASALMVTTGHSSSLAASVDGRSSSVGPASGSGLTPTVSQRLGASGRRSTMMSRDGDFFFIHGSVINQYGNIETQNSSAFVTRHSMDMKFSYCHERLSDYLGYDIKSLMGLSFYSMIHPQDLIQLKADFKELYQKHQVCTGVYRLMAKSGGYIWLTTEASVVTQGTRSGRGQHIVCIHQVVSSPDSNEILADVQQHLSTLLCQIQQQNQSNQAVHHLSGHLGITTGGQLVASATVRPDYVRKMFLNGSNGGIVTNGHFGGPGGKCYDPPPGPLPVHLTNGHSYNAIVTNTAGTTNGLLDRAPLINAGADVGNLPFWDTDDTSMYNYDRWLFRDSSASVKSSSPTTPHTPTASATNGTSGGNKSATSVFTALENVARSGIKRGSAPTCNFNGVNAAADSSRDQDLHEQEGAQSAIAKLATCQQRGRGPIVGVGGGNVVAGGGPIGVELEHGGGVDRRDRNGIGRTTAYGGLGVPASADDLKAASGDSAAATNGNADATGIGAAKDSANAAGGHQRRQQQQCQQQQTGFARASPESMSEIVPADGLGSAGSQANSNGNLYPSVSDAGFSIANDLTDKFDDLKLLAPFVDTGELVTLDLVPSDLDLDFGDFKDLTNDLFSLDKKAEPFFSPSSANQNMNNNRYRTISTNQNYLSSSFLGITPPTIDGYWMFNGAGGHLTSSTNPFRANDVIPVPPIHPQPFYESYAGAANQSYWPPFIACSSQPIGSCCDDVIGGTSSTNQNEAIAAAALLGLTPNNNSLPQAHPDFFNAVSLLSLNNHDSYQKNNELSIFEHQSPSRLAQTTIDNVLSSSLPECKPVIKYCNTDTSVVVENFGSAHHNQEPTNQVKVNPVSSDLIGRPGSCAVAAPPPLAPNAIGHVPSSCSGGGTSGTSTPIGRSIVEEAGHGYARQLNNDTVPASFLFGSHSNNGGGSQYDSPSINSMNHVIADKSASFMSSSTSLTNQRSITPFISSVFNQSGSSVTPPSSCNLWQPASHVTRIGITSSAATNRKRPAPTGSAHQHKIRYKETVIGGKKQHVQFAYQTGGTTVIGRKLNTVGGVNSSLGITASNNIYPSCYQGGTNVVIKRAPLGAATTGIRASAGMSASGGHLFNNGLSSSFLKPSSMSTSVVTHNGITASSSNPSVFKRYQQQHQNQHHQQQPPIGSGLFADSSISLVGGSASNWNQPIGLGGGHHFSATPFHTGGNQSQTHQIIVAATEPTNNATKIRYVRATYNANHHSNGGGHHGNGGSSSSSTNENSQPPVLQSLAPPTRLDSSDLIGGTGGLSKLHQQQQQQPPLLPLAIC